MRLCTSDFHRHTPLTHVCVNPGSPSITSVRRSARWDPQGPGAGFGAAGPRHSHADAPPAHSSGRKHPPAAAALVPVGPESERTRSLGGRCLATLTEQALMRWASPGAAFLAARPHRCERLTVTVQRRSPEALGRPLSGSAARRRRKRCRR
eukprot:scaffold5657_cov270-Pinguiococcus_pyrenoidosus.AAC.8